MSWIETKTGEGCKHLRLAVETEEEKRARLENRVLIFVYDKVRVLSL